MACVETRLHELKALPQVHCTSKNTSKAAISPKSTPTLSVSRTRFILTPTLRVALAQQYTTSSPPLAYSELSIQTKAGQCTRTIAAARAT